ncbi:MAG TPA: aminopeptidase P family protein [Azospirillaceae bacterium]|nr:aminopeptidase P family protein [Azospirillaceae bacterium]
MSDPRLADLLAAAGIHRSASEIRALVAGVAAAPPDVDPDAWLALVAPTVSGELRHHLQLLLDTARHRAATRPDVHAHVAALRAELARRNLDGFIIPRADEHQGEYVPLNAQRLIWASGFTGSAGVAIVLKSRGALFIDGRYTLQAQTETPADLFEFRHLIDDPHAEWLVEALPDGGRVGFDPRLHTIGWLERAQGGLTRAAIDLVPCPDNPVDAVWSDRPPAPLAPVVPHDERFAGRPAADKRAEVAVALTRAGLGAAVLTQPDSIAWLLNIRGGDVACTPLPLSFAIVTDEATVDLFIDRRKLVPGMDTHLGNAVRVRDPDELGSALESLGARPRPVRADPATASAWVFDRLMRGGAHVERGPDPCALPKACKNAVELEGMRRAHVRDGLAMARFLAWLDATAPAGAVTEIAATERLLALRAEGERFRGLSFETIAGAGPNGAIVHYRVTPETDRRLESGGLFLIDSGAQYLDGTTDITRTVAVGGPTAEMRDRFTRVLKGHIAVATARFPKGTTGSQLDALARLPLWRAGLDYDHGTGHGVGSFLSVHEGPQRISKVGNTTALQPGMILSNEPGYYKTGAYGIRIENLVAVRCADEMDGAERPMLAFDTLTLAPIDRRLIEAGLLSAEERAWLDAYHARVRDTLSPLLDPTTRAWLAAATLPLVS